MSDYAAVYRHFADFAEATVIGRGKEKITEDDIDLFLEKFLSTGFHFWYEGIKIPHANNVDPETQVKAFDMTDKTLAEATKELKPLLMLKVQETYGQVSDEPNDKAIYMSLISSTLSYWLGKNDGEKKRKGEV